MKEITVLSGKGGTGKTTVTAALASVGSNLVLCDNDVDAADLHLILKPDIREENIYLGAYQAEIQTDKCTACGICMDYCRFNAIYLQDDGMPMVQNEQCEGCRLCERICPQDAITSEQSKNNKWFISETRFGNMVHAEMGPGEENSGKLVSLVRKKAKHIAEISGADYILNDGPPGVGCSAISSISGTNVVLLVSEPSISGLSDAERLVELAKSFRIPVLGIVNKADLNEEIGNRIKQFFKINDIPLLAEIPFDKNVVEAMIHEKSIVEYDSDLEISKRMLLVWQQIVRFLNNSNDYR